MRRPIRSYIGWALVVVVALVAVAVAYQQGGDEADTGEATLTPATPAEHPDPGPGCRGSGATDPADNVASRPVARCAPGTPRPQPLDGGRSVRVAVVRGAPATVPVLVADELGEFEAEGLDVDVATMAVDEAHDALAGGEVDAVVGPLDASFFDGAHGDSGARWVMGGTIPRAPHDFDAPQAGLWMHSGVIDDRQRWADIENHTLALPGGIGSVTVLPVGRALDQGESSLNAVDIRSLDGRAAVDALLAGEVTAAWIPAGGVERVAGADGIELMITYPAGEPLDGTVMSADLLGAERQTAAAYTRAVIRTINTHLARAVDGDLDERVLAVVDEVLAPAGQTPEGPAVPLCDWEIRSGTTDRIQAEYSELGSVAYEGVLPESEVVDRSLVAEVIDAAG